MILLLYRYNSHAIKMTLFLSINRLFRYRCEPEWTFVHYMFRLPQIRR